MTLKTLPANLASMFRQVMNTMFTCIEQYEPVWKEIHAASPKQKCLAKLNKREPEPIQVSLPATIEAFKNNYDTLSRYLQIISGTTKFKTNSSN